MTPNAIGINLLPNEIICHILDPFSTRTLLPLSAVSHRFHDLILRIIHHRILTAASLTDHYLILECYHPSARLTAPGLFCDNLGTDSLNDTTEGEPQLYGDEERTGRLGKLAGVYSHFRPMTRDIFTGRWGLSQSDDGAENAPNVEDITSEIISLESHELFSQLCTSAHLVKAKRGRILACVTIGEGVIRVWRDWLAQHAVLPNSLRDRPVPTIIGPASSSTNNRRMLWLDESHNIGIRLRVIEREDLSTPILLRRDEDAPVSYGVEFEELVIRTAQLLLRMEESLEQELNRSGKAIMQVR